MTKIETPEGFFSTVAVMRHTQKEYSRYRSPAALRAAKNLEALVDAAIEEREARRDTTGNLFGEGIE
jgi:hypothetical protein